MNLGAFCEGCGYPRQIVENIPEDLYHTSKAKQVVLLLWRGRKWGYAMSLPELCSRQQITLIDYYIARFQLHGWLTSDPPLTLEYYRACMVRVLNRVESRLPFPPLIWETCRELVEGWEIIGLNPALSLLQCCGASWRWITPRESRVEVFRHLRDALQLSVTTIGMYCMVPPLVRWEIIP